MNNTTVTVYEDTDGICENDCIILHESNYYYYSRDIILTQTAEIMPTILDGALIPSADAAADCGDVIAVINIDLETMTVTVMK